MNPPNPGSSAAQAQGCTCPVIDNGYGAGIGYCHADGSPAFWITNGCPLHAPAQESRGPHQEPAV